MPSKASIGEPRSITLPCKGEDRREQKTTLITIIKRQRELLSAAGQVDKQKAEHQPTDMSFNQLVGVHLMA